MHSTAPNAEPDWPGKQVPHAAGWQQTSPAWTGQRSTGAWTVDDTFTANICFNETPFVVTVWLKFSGGEVRLESEANVGFGPTKDAALVGKAE